MIHPVRLFPALATVLSLVAPAAGAVEWNVDPTRSHLGFTGTQSGTPFQGRFQRWTARIAFDPADPAGGKAVVDIDMTSAATGDRLLDASLPEADWFDVKAHPQARFESTRFRATGANAYEALGRLTLRGVAKEVVLPFTLDLLPTGNARFRGGLNLIRTDFGVGRGAWSTAQVVGLEVAVTFELGAKAR